LQDGTVLPVGGKTGTGDNRFEVAPYGSAVASRAVNRTAAFVFFIGDKYFGTVLAYVPGKNADKYDFTSALAVQVFEDIMRKALPAIEQREATPVQSVSIKEP